MNKTLLIIKHEYLKRVKKKSFLIMTLLTPILMSAVYVVPFLLAMTKDDKKVVQVVDESTLVQTAFKDTEEFTFEFPKENIETLKSKIKNSNTDALVFVPKDILTNPGGLAIYAEKNVSLGLKSNVEKVIEAELYQLKLKNEGMDIAKINASKVKINANTFSVGEEGEKKNSTEAAAVVGYILAFLLYGVLFIYGAQVMRSVTEEKTSRIIEVIVSSVKPVQLMYGKIVGVGLVGLTQFVLWIVLAWGIGTAALSFFAKDAMTNQKAKIEMAQKAAGSNPAMDKEVQQATQGEMGNILESAKSLPIASLIINFLIYFLGGYLLYSALFAAVGAAVDNETDTQQFMLPISLPIIISIVIAPAVMKDPDGTLAFWASIIPFTSPINMMIRVPYGVPFWQLLLSYGLLIVGFLGTTWLAARIYRVGILMYGKKVNFKELSKWIFYKA